MPPSDGESTLPEPPVALRRRGLSLQLKLARIWWVPTAPCSALTFERPDERQLRCA
jgi:hypothetical protein